VKVILARLDAAERNDVFLVRIHHHRARKLRGLLIHVGVELCLRIGRNRRRVERHVMGPAADHDELDRVARLDRDVRRVETIALVVADHLDGDGLAGRRDLRQATSCRSRSRWGWGARRRSGSRCIVLLGFTAAAGADDGDAREEC